MFETFLKTVIIFAVLFEVSGAEITHIAYYTPVYLKNVLYQHSSWNLEVFTDGATYCAKVQSNCESVLVKVQ